MALILRIKSADGKSSEVPLSGGLILGRAPGVQVHLNDPKLSAKHAQVDLIAPGQFMLLDLGSTNGIRYNGKKVTELALTVGTAFRMGNTEFTVVEGAPQREAPAIDSAPPPPPAKKASTTAPTKPKPEPKIEPAPAPKWSEFFIKFIETSLKKIQNRPRDLAPFRRILKLSFIRGLQTDTVWNLGYGPREIGPSSVDLVIEEASAPPICFTVEPSGTDVIFKTEHPALVRLNERSVKSDTLKSGDVISIAETRITVGFAE